MNVVVVLLHSLQRDEDSEMEVQRVLMGFLLRKLLSAVLDLQCFAEKRNEACMRMLGHYILPVLRFQNQMDLLGFQSNQMQQLQLR